MCRPVFLARLVLLSLLTTTLALGAEPGTLRQRLAPDALAYLRIPGPWGLLTESKGSALDPALASTANQAAAQLIRDALAARLGELPDPATSLAGRWLATLRSPLELALVSTPTGPNLLAQGRFGFSDTEAFREELERLLATLPEPQLNARWVADDTASIDTPGGAIHLHFDPADGSLRLRAGPGAEAAGLDAPAGAPADEHPMASFEDAIDQSGQGLFLWLNGPALRPLLETQLDAEARAMLAQFGFNPPGQAALGYGVSGGHGKLSVLLDLPEAGLLNFVPRLETRLGLESVGEPGVVVLLSLPLPALLRQGEALLAAEGGEDFQDYQSFRRELETTLGMPLDQALASVGPEIVVFSDAVGEFVALRVNDRERLTTLLGTLAANTEVRYDTLDMQDHTLHRLVIPGEEEPLHEWSPATYFYWIDDGDYLVLGQLPQSLRDRLDAEARLELGPWLRDTQGQNPDNALLLISTRLERIPRRTYYAYLQILQMLADLSGAELDLLAFPSARQLDLPETGAYGLQLDLGQRLGLSFTFQNNPLEFLMQPGLGSVAAVGVVAAVAIPAYMALSEDMGID